MNSFCKQILICAEDPYHTYYKYKYNDIQSNFTTRRYYEDKDHRQLFGGIKSNAANRRSKQDVWAESVTYRMSTTHEVCNQDAKVIVKGLPCALHAKTAMPKEIFLLR